MELDALDADSGNVKQKNTNSTKTDKREPNKLLYRVEQVDAIVSIEVIRITKTTKQLCEAIDLAESRKIKLV